MLLSYTGGYKDYLLTYLLTISSFVSHNEWFQNDCWLSFKSTIPNYCQSVVILARVCLIHAYLKEYQFMFSRYEV